MALPSLDDLLAPISPDAPSGVDLRYHPITDQIKEARRAEDTASQGVWKREVKEADFRQAVKLCRDALTKHGKDLQVAAWLTEALTYQDGIPGLIFGLQLVHQLLDRFWDTVHPELEDGDVEMRATPLLWIGSQLEMAVKSTRVTRSGLSWVQYTESKSIPSEEGAYGNSEQEEIRRDAIELGKVTPEDFEKAFQETPYAQYKDTGAKLAQALEALEALAAFCDEKFGDESPNLSGLRGALEEVQTTVRILMVRKRDIEGIVEQSTVSGPEEDEEEEAPEPESEAQYEEAAPAPTPVRTRKATALTAEPTSPEDAEKRIVDAAQYLRRANPCQPPAYLVTRALRWGELRAAGSQPSYELLAAPPTDVRVDLKRLFQEGEFEQALDLAERAMAMPCGRAWLDLQRYAVRCCEGLGGYYSEVAAAIKDELRALLASYPQLPQWSLADDTATANAETLAWLEEEHLLPGQEAPREPARQDWPPPPVYTAPQEQDGAPPDVADLAMEAARGGRIQEAVALLWREASQETSGRGRFQRRSQLARICLLTHHHSIALPILRELNDEIASRSLEEWEEPEMVAQVLVMYFNALDGDEGALELRRSVYERICRLDPMQALELGARP